MSARIYVFRNENDKKNWKFEITCTCSSSFPGITDGPRPVLTDPRCPLPRLRMDAGQVQSGQPLPGPDPGEAQRGSERGGGQRVHRGPEAEGPRVGGGGGGRGGGGAGGRGGGEERGQERLGAVEIRSEPAEAQRGSEGGEWKRPSIFLTISISSPLHRSFVFIFDFAMCFQKSSQEPNLHALRVRPPLPRPRFLFPYQMK